MWLRILASLPPVFRSLVERRGFAMVQAEDRGTMGQWFAVLASKEMQLRVTGDRGDVFLDVASILSGSEWLDVGLIASLLVGRDLCEPSRVDELASFMDQHYDSIRNLLSPEILSNTTQQVHDLGEKRANKIFGA